MQAPSVPSATQTAQAQTASNVQTAQTQSELNAVNQNTPTGSLAYTQNGTWADGTPKLTATTTLSAPEQQLLQSQQQINQNLGNLGVTESGKLGGLLDQPFNVDQATENQLDSLASQRLEPQLQRDQTSLQQQLANKGIAPGSAAYNSAVTLQGQTQNDARNSLILNGYNQAQQSALLQRQEPINEILALGGQTQVASPNFVSTPQSGVASTNVADLTNNQYNQQLAQYQGQTSALGSIASTLGGWAFSSPELKTDVHDTGLKTKDNIPVKTFKYRGSPMLQMGVMAPDAEKKRPDAVRDVGRFQQVDYGKLGSPMLRMGAR